MTPGLLEQHRIEGAAVSKARCASLRPPAAACARTRPVSCARVIGGGWSSGRPRDAQRQLRIADAAGARGGRLDEGHRPQVAQQAGRIDQRCQRVHAQDRVVRRRPDRAGDGHDPSAARAAGGSAPANPSAPAGPPGPSARAPAGRRSAGPGSAPSARAPSSWTCRQSGSWAGTSVLPKCCSGLPRAAISSSANAGSYSRLSPHGESAERPSVIDSKSTKASSRRKARAKARPDEDDQLQRLRDNLSLPAKCKQAIPPCGARRPGADSARILFCSRSARLVHHLD